MLRISAGKFKNRLLKAPETTETRPTSGRIREMLFNIVQNEIEGATFLDLFAGSGAMGIEAISHGAAHSTFVDSSRICYDCIKENINTLGISAQTTVLCTDVFDALEKLVNQQAQFDVIYIDPPYNTETTFNGETVSLGIRLLLEIDRLALLKPSGTLFIEEGKKALDNRALETLVLKKARKAGRTTLWQFIPK